MAELRAKCEANPAGYTTVPNKILAQLAVAFCERFLLVAERADMFAAFVAEQEANLSYRSKTTGEVARSLGVDSQHRAALRPRRTDPT